MDGQWGVGVLHIPHGGQTTGNRIKSIAYFSLFSFIGPIVWVKINPLDSSGEAWSLQQKMGRLSGIEMGKQGRNLKFVDQWKKNKDKFSVTTFCFFLFLWGWCVERKKERRGKAGQRKYKIKKASAVCNLFTPFNHRSAVTTNGELTSALFCLLTSKSMSKLLSTRTKGTKSRLTRQCRWAGDRMSQEYCGNVVPPAIGSQSRAVCGSL